MNPYFAPSEAELLAHSSYLENLSRRLVADPQTADDIVQDAWLAALESPPPHSINVSGWFGAVARNLARRSSRTRKRQEVRETQAARPEWVASVDEEFDRESSLTRIVHAVESLAEPYRTVVYLRYFEGIPPREIAEQLDTPATTIKSQLHRGLEQLRAELEEEFGQDGADWRGVLCICFGWPSPASSPQAASPVASEPALSMFNVFAVLLIASGFAAILLGSQWQPIDTRDEILAATLRNQTRDLSLPDRSERVAIASSAARLTNTTTPIPLHVQVVDHETRPVAGADVWIATKDDLKQRATTDENGLAKIYVTEDDLTAPRVFSEMQTAIPPIAPRLGVQATTNEHPPSTISWIELERVRQDQVTIQLAKNGFSLAGVIQDPAGNPIAGARVERHDPREGVHRSADSDLAVQPVFATWTDSFGRFKFESFPLGPYWLRIQAEGFAICWQRRVMRELGAELALDVVLKHTGKVRGYVQGPDGQPVSGARVWTHTSDQVHLLETQSGAAGEFELTGIEPGQRHVFAQGGPNGEWATRWQLLFKPNDVLDWNPQLAAIKGIHLRIVDEDGTPRTNLLVYMRLKTPNFSSRINSVTDEQGRLTLYVPAGDVHRIDFALAARYGTMYAFPEAHLTQLEAGGEFRDVVLPRTLVENGKIHFDLFDAEGKPHKKFAFLARNAHDGILRRIAAGTNTSKVRASNVAPGELELVLSCTGIGLVEFDPVSLKPGQTIELPAYRTKRPGIVRFDWQVPRQASLEAGIVQFLHLSDSQPSALQMRRTKNQALLESYELLPGEYGLQLFESRQLIRTLHFTIQEGFETLVVIESDDEN